MLRVASLVSNILPEKGMTSKEHKAGTLNNNNDGIELHLQEVKSEFVQRSTSLQLFDLVQFVKCWLIFLELKT